MSYRVTISGVMTAELAAWIASRYVTPEAEAAGFRVKVTSESGAPIHLGGSVGVPNPKS